MIQKTGSFLIVRFMVWVGVLTSPGMCFNLRFLKLQTAEMNAEYGCMTSKDFGLFLVIHLFFSLLAFPQMVGTQNAA